MFPEASRELSPGSLLYTAGFMDIRDYNREAWNKQVDGGSEWTVPVDAEKIAAARRGEWSVGLTESKHVPREWFPDLAGLDVLCLASSGGQQAPIFAAAGARVTSFDNSPRQLSQDRLVADREGLDIVTVEGDMRDLSALADESFDLAFHAVSNCFVPEIRPVWKEAFRALRRGGVLLAGFLNPAIYIFDTDLAERGELKVRNALPYSDLTDMPEEELRRRKEAGEPLEFSHSLEDQIGGQIDAGFVITGFYEDRHRTFAPARFMPTYVATRAVKL
jgi:SAM-dependent methyltransferase